MIVWVPNEVLTFWSGSLRLSPSHISPQSWGEIYQNFGEIPLIQRLDNCPIIPHIRASQSEVVLWKPSDGKWDFLETMYQNTGIELRKYQQEMIQAIFKQKVSIVCLPTNTGLFQ